MRNDPLPRRPRQVTRRTALQGLGALIAGSAAGGDVAAALDDGSHQVVQGDQTHRVEPLTSDVPVEHFYSYRLPDQYTGVGVYDMADGPFYESFGTRYLQRESTTICFLYDGPNGLSFVVVHDKATTDGDGGAATWQLTTGTESVEWLVKDDAYWELETGDRASNNYDNWNTDGTDHEIDWTWGTGGTDGGVLGYFDDQLGVTIRPAYNERAVLYDEYYSGSITDWQFLSGDRDDPDRISLALDEPVAIVGPDTDGPVTAPSSSSSGTETADDEERYERAEREEIGDDDGEVDDGDEDDRVADEGEDDDDDEDEREEKEAERENDDHPGLGNGPKGDKGPDKDNPGKAKGRSEDKPGNGHGRDTGNPGKGNGPKKDNPGRGK